jgi:hypothetical protein
MKRENGARLALALALASTMLATAGTMTAVVRADCAGLPCVDCSDCGTACFCNRPTQECHSNAAQ